MGDGTIFLDRKKIQVFMLISYIFFIMAITLLCVQVAYPVVLMIFSLLVNPRSSHCLKLVENPYRVTMIISVYARDLHLLPEKLINTSKLQYSSTHLEIVVSGDGELTELPGLVEQAPSIFPIKYTQTGAWVGKNQSMNKAVEIAKGDILVISDVDTHLETDALVLIIRKMNDSGVGGVCGALKIFNTEHMKPGLAKVQDIYWSYERWVKSVETRVLGSVTACGGPLIAIRKDLYPGLPPDVNDDLYLTLTIVETGHRFLAESEALAYVSPPSKTISDEFKRRPRIVSAGLTAIWSCRKLFIKKSTFFYGLCLFFHKVVRRLSPVLLTVIFITTGFLAFWETFWAFFFGFQILFYAICLLSLLGLLTGRIFTIFAYFLAVNIGTLIGLYEFMIAKGRSKW